MENGVGVWIRDNTSNIAWVPGIIVSKNNINDKLIEIVVSLDDGRTKPFRVPADASEIDDVKLRNDESESYTNDLISLPHLHEPAILHSLSSRYNQGDIYTFTGPILLAINPFKSLPIYTSQILESYYNFGLLKSQGIDQGEAMPPHVYSIADAAFRDMMSFIRDNTGANQIASQAILISGESGAGKTESTKIVMKYLATVGNSAGTSGVPAGSIMDKVLQSNPILEAFGNAKTIRNDNSSRFGKFIEIHFSKKGIMLGAAVKTYLLEKVRIPAQATNERNFHIFYQLLKSGDDAILQQLSLFGLGPADFHYTEQGGVYDLRYVNDTDDFRATLHAMRTLEFSEQQITDILSLIGGILNLGEVNFEASADGESSNLARDQQSRYNIDMCAQLCGVASSQFITALTTRLIETRGESFVSRLRQSQATDSRDALAKIVYSRLFDWIVAKINSAIQTDIREVKAYVGVLDIFGFECFKHNSFEQLCINFTNETLQQQFNQFVFKIEQEEYTREQIEWSFIEFPDNQDCLDLIEGKPNGILAMLDDECRLPKGSDEKFANRLYKDLSGHPRFIADVTQRRDSLFAVRHYAGAVVYDAITFVEKNRDEVAKETLNLFQASRIRLARDIFSDSGFVEEKSDSASATPARVSVRSPAKPDTPASQGKAFKSVGTYFKNQLHELMEKIHGTKPHYVRCIKPNDENISDLFVRSRVTEQLRYGGVLEAVRVARSGFPIRLRHADFYARYRCLANPNHPLTKTLPRYIPHKQLENRERTKTFCEILIRTLFEDSQKDEAKSMSRKAESVRKWLCGTCDPRQIQLGLSKVFLRRLAYDLLERRRSYRIAGATVIIQACFRGHKAMCHYRTIKIAVVIAQRVYRGVLGRRVATHKRMVKSSIAIQRMIRGRVRKWQYARFHWWLIRTQSRYRGRVARAVALVLRRQKAAKFFQTSFRRFTRRSKYCKLRSAAIALQCRFRIRSAWSFFKKLKQEAKDIGKLQQNNETMKREIQELRRFAQEEAARARDEAAKIVMKQAEATRLELEQALRSAEIEKSQAASMQARMLSDQEKMTRYGEERMRLCSLLVSLGHASDDFGIMESKNESFEELLKHQIDTIIGTIKYLHNRTGELQQQLDESSGQKVILAQQLQSQLNDFNESKKMLQAQTDSANQPKLRKKRSFVSPKLDGNHSDILKLVATPSSEAAKGNDQFESNRPSMEEFDDDHLFFPEATNKEAQLASVSESRENVQEPNQQSTDQRNYDADLQGSAVGVSVSESKQHQKESGNVGGQHANHHPLPIDIQASHVETSSDHHRVTSNEQNRPVSSRSIPSEADDAVHDLREAEPPSSRSMYTRSRGASMSLKEAEETDRKMKACEDESVYWRNKFLELDAKFSDAIVKSTIPQITSQATTSPTAAQKTHDATATTTNTPVTSNSKLGTNQAQPVQQSRSVADARAKIESSQSKSVAPTQTPAASQGQRRPLNSNVESKKSSVDVKQVATSSGKVLGRSDSRNLIAKEVLAIKGVDKLNQLTDRWGPSWDQDEEDDEGDKMSRSNKILRQRGQIAKFETNMESFRQTLEAGTRVLTWESGKASRLDCTLKFAIPPDPRTLTAASTKAKQDKRVAVQIVAAMQSVPHLSFVPVPKPKKVMSLLVKEKERDPVDPVPIHEILEVRPGHMDLPDLVNQEMANHLTILTIPTPVSGQGRSIVVEFGDRYTRNSCLTCLRNLMTDASSGMLTQGNATTPHVTTAPNQDADNSGIYSIMRRISSTFGSAADAPQELQSTIIPSIIEEEDPDDTLVHLSEVRKQILTERVNFEKMMIQVVEMTNDLNAREEDVQRLRQQISEITDQVQRKEKRSEQDADIRIQLGKRLEQVLLEKEELREQLRYYQAHGR